MGVNSGRTGRLKSWKEIAAFFGADERTVRRWEARGLPVHRIPGGARATVYAEVGELEAWFSGRSSPGAGVVQLARPIRLVAAAALLLLVAAAVIAYMRGGADTAREPQGRAIEHYLAATYQFERRTADSLNRALAGYNKAIAEDPAYAEAHAGVANTYLLLREFARMPDAEAYPRARDAAERALQLDDRLGQAHAARAFVTFYWERDWRRGLERFRRAIELDPRSARSRHWYATALFHSGAFPQALAAIDGAQRLDPQSRSILADKALILFHAGRTGEALAILQPMATSEPEFLSPHSYLATIHHARRDYPAYLEHARIAARLTGDRERLAMLEEAGQALSAGGREAMLGAILAHQQRRREAREGSAYAVAETLAQLGRTEAALDQLEASARAGEPDMLALRVDPMLQPLEGEARFRELAEQLGRPAV